MDLNLTNKYLGESKEYNTDKIKKLRKEFIKFDGNWTDKFMEAVKGTPIGTNLAKQVDDHMNKIDKILSILIKKN